MRVLNFHRIEPPTGLEITRISPCRFDRILDTIDESGRGVIRLNEEPVMENCERCLMTIDDGFASLVEHALPELVRRRWKVIVFLVAGAVGGRDDWDIRILGRARAMLTWEQVRTWSTNGVEFGSHSMTHADLTSLSEHALHHELHESKSGIEDRIGKPVRYLSYPFGRHNRRVREAARASGYEAGFATSVTDGTADGRFAIPRVSLSLLTGLGELRSLLQSRDGQWRGAWKHRIFESLNAGSATVGNWRRSRLSDSANRPKEDSEPSVVGA